MLITNAVLPEPAMYFCGRVSETTCETCFVKKEKKKKIIHG